VSPVLRYVTLPSGRRVTLGAYVRAWKRALAIAAGDPDAWVPNAYGDGFGYPISAILRTFREGMHDRINQAVPASERGVVR
jgi:hypothetical protein